MAMCITQDLKTLLINMLDKKTPHEALKIFADAVPTCESIGLGVATSGKAAVAGAQEAKKHMATPWPKAVYVDQKGKSTEYDSASALYEKLTGKKPSGSICNEEGTKCTPVTLIDSFRFFGYTIQGDGEPAPETDPEKSYSVNLKAHQDWKDHLKATGKKIIVIHPKSPTIKKIQE